MNCFDWQSRSSEYLDGVLPPPAKEEADRHLQTCHECSARHQHYRLILTSVASQPRISMPPALRKAPLSAILPMPALGVEEDLAGAAQRSQGRHWHLRATWERVPWLVRTTLEGSGIVLLILVGISAGPKLRKMYEHHMEQSLGEFTESFSSSEKTEDGVPLARGRVATATNVAAAVPESETGPAGSDDYSGENEGDDENDDSGSGDSAVNEEGLRVGNSEIWRFNLRTDSPLEVRHRIVQILSDLHVPPNTTGFGGVEAPGGIQFDLLVPRGIVLELKKQLQKLSPKQSPVEGSTVASADNFTWYKNRSKRKIPDGRARVVIWLSQI